MEDIDIAYYTERYLSRQKGTELYRKRRRSESKEQVEGKHGRNRIIAYRKLLPDRRVLFLFRLCSGLIGEERGKRGEERGKREEGRGK